jgi:hypothetical protein
VQRRQYFPLTEIEEAEFQSAMFGREDLKGSAPDVSLLSPFLPNAGE